MRTPLRPDREVQTETIPVICRICGKPVGIVVPAEGEEFRELFERVARRAVHSECADRAQAELAAARILEQERERARDWALICPVEFQKPLNPSKRGFNSSRLKMVMEWRYGEMGLRIEGPSGLCKTRFMYQLLEREDKDGRKVGAYMHGALRTTLSSLAAGDSAKLAAFVSDLHKLDVLLIDDLGKGRGTPAAEEAFFSLVDGRAQSCRPTLFTSNVPLEKWALEVSEIYRVPLIRRIEDKTRLIKFE